MTLNPNLQKLIQFVWGNSVHRFIIIGCLNTIVGYGIFALSVFLGVHYALAIMLFPATANLVTANLGMVNAASYDISAACSGFLFALTTASKMIEAGMYKKVVVVGADKMSSIVDLGVS